MVKPIEKPAIKHRKMNDVRLVVGIGASAGGLEALQQFFLKLPANSNIAFVIVQHLSPDYKSLMAEILGKYTPMQVVQAEHLQEVAPNRVYLIPPKKNLTIKAGHLLLTDYDHRAINHPIDVFFTSLAEESCDRAVGIVLSGTGSDGTNGIKSIKEHGGIVMAQDPKSAKFDGMPRSVINTGLADFVLTPQGLAEELLNLANYHQTMLPQVSSESSDLEILNRIYAILKALSGIDFTYYKRNTVLRRIERRMVVTKSPDMESFAQLLEENSSEAELLIKDILIGVTRFFRDREHFEKLKQTALTSILSNGEANEPVRIWSAGCSTGEEAYSIAILLQELKEELGSKREIKIFATDIDTQAIEKASKGVFPESISEDVSPERLAKYFVEKNDQYHISKEIRKMIIFAPHNMFSDPPFGKLDLISCRNVLIYFQPVLQKAVFAIFHTALKNGGYLFLGKSETASEYSSVFKAVATSEKIYAHYATGKADDLQPPVFTLPNILPQVKVTGARSSRSEDEQKMEDLYVRFLERFLPASVVIDGNNEIIHFFGNSTDFVSIVPGKASFNLFSLINADLKLIASTAVNRCRTEHTSVTYTDVVVDTNTGRRRIDFSVQPISGTGDRDGLIAVIFTDHAQSNAEGKLEKYDVDSAAAQRIADLEHELQGSRSELRSTIGELETVNEELQASNEELLTANEELQSSNEELQSVNEELYTVNSEYQQKLDELTMMDNDLSNFLSSTMIGILFVDSKLNIRKFTEYVGREFQLVQQDVGRSLQIFAHSFPEEDIIADAKEVLRNLAPIDREVVGTNERFYTMRIAPYRTAENSIRGLVITIIDSLHRPQAVKQPATPDKNGKES